MVHGWTRVCTAYGVNIGSESVQIGSLDGLPVLDSAHRASLVWVPLSVHTLDQPCSHTGGSACCTQHMRLIQGMKCMCCIHCIDQLCMLDPLHRAGLGWVLHAACAPDGPYVLCVGPRQEHAACMELELACRLVPCPYSVLWG